ncbi:MAG: hypothetical protein MUD12_16735 [Spirochaetes bacterium]|nr:hypothetical protein [Spirochaetota bacterium]
MKKDLFEKIIDSEPCPEEIQQIILELSSGTLSPQNEKRALKHLSECDSCRFMFNIYHDTLEEMEAEKTAEDANLAREIMETIKQKNEPAMAEKILSVLSEINENFRKMTGRVLTEADSIMQDIFSPISLIMLNSGLVPVVAGTQRNTGVPKEKITFSFTSSDEERKGYVIIADATIRIQIECSDTDKRFYIIGKDETKSTRPDKGMVTFDNIRPGAYLLCEDMIWLKSIMISEDTIDE